MNSESFNWNSILRHVVRAKTTVEISENDVPVARIEPIRRSISMSELNSVLSALPSLGTDIDSFATDIERALSEFPDADDPWAS